MCRQRSDSGQASVELVALLPLLLAVLLACVAGRGRRPGVVARRKRGARGRSCRARRGDPLAAARRELPGGLRRHLRVRRSGDDVVVRLAIPAVAGLGRLGTATARVRAGATRP